MTRAPSSLLSQDQDLRHALRDVLGLMALPAVWRNKAAPEILTTLAQALDAVLDIDCILVVAAGTEPIVICHRAGCRDDELAVRARVWFRNCLTSTSLVQRLACDELGELTVACEPLAFGGLLGHVVVASRAPDFPTPRELVLIKTASSLVTNALEMAAALAEREEALRAKDDFLALLGHELRNPLAPIVTALDLMQQRTPGAPSREQQVMRRQVDHLRRLVDDLLDASRVARNVLVMQKEPVCLADVMTEALDATAPLFDEYEHALLVNMPPAHVFVDADPIRLSQAIGNLLTNAAKYTPRGGSIHIQAEPREHQVQITVRDNGVGIDETLMPRIFEKFVQGKQQVDRRHGGLGIGLSLVRTLVEMHGGTVSARSAGNGAGAEFVVLLPVSTERAAQTWERARLLEPRPKERRRVLVVDDNVDAAEMLVAAFEAAGYAAHMVTHPLAALDIVEELQPDIGILDIGMPVMDGYELCTRIRQRFPDKKLPLVALTGYGTDTDKQRARAAGFDVHCAKPMKLSALLDEVRTLLGEASPAEIR